MARKGLLAIGVILLVFAMFLIWLFAFSCSVICMNPDPIAGLVMLGFLILGFIFCFMGLILSKKVAPEVRVVQLLNDQICKGCYAKRNPHGNFCAQCGMKY